MLLYHNPPIDTVCILKSKPFRSQTTKEIYMHTCVVARGSFLLVFVLLLFLLSCSCLLSCFSYSCFACFCFLFVVRRYCCSFSVYCARGVISPLIFAIREVISASSCNLLRCPGASRSHLRYEGANPLIRYVLRLLSTSCSRELSLRIRVINPHIRTCFSSCVLVSFRFIHEFTLHTLRLVEFNRSIHDTHCFGCGRLLRVCACRGCSAA